jgi:site-specific DNA-methyltransferase (adenine-specific)
VRKAQQLRIQAENIYLPFQPRPDIGETVPIAPCDYGFQLHYEHPNGKLFLGDSIEWLASQATGTVDLIFADPPYNINKADWDNFESQEAYINWSIRWIEHAARVLKPTGSLFVCGYSEILADVKHPASHFFKHAKWLVWHYKNKANLGSDWGRSHESILHFRKTDMFRLNVDDVRISYGNHTLKYPSHPQAITSQYGNGKKRNGEWEPNPLGAKPKDVIEIPTISNGMAEKTLHPTQKPEELLRRLVLAASDEGQLVVDPFSGSGTTAVVAEQLGRKWMACELSTEYNRRAISRIENIKPMPVSKWIDFDRTTAARRESIR